MGCVGSSVHRAVGAQGTPPVPPLPRCRQAGPTCRQPDAVVHPAAQPGGHAAVGARRPQRRPPPRQHAVQRGCAPVADLRLGAGVPGDVPSGRRHTMSRTRVGKEIRRGGRDEGTPPPLCTSTCRGWMRWSVEPAHCYWWKPTAQGSNISCAQSEVGGAHRLTMAPARQPAPPGCKPALPGRRPARGAAPPAPRCG
mgnify:CR=1 FL=1